MRRTGRRLLVAMLALAAAAPMASAQPDADELLRTAESRWSSAMSWLKRQRDVAGAEIASQIVEAQRQLEELRKSADDTVMTARVRMAVGGRHAGLVVWEERLPGSEAKAPERLVLLVHGLDEPGGIWDEAAPEIVGAGFSLARFDYSNDQGIARCSDELAAALRQLKTSGVNRIDLVCHSMGGLIARDVLTRAEFYNSDGNGGADFPTVERLILIGTPNRGSAFAPLQRVSEMREQLVRLIDSGEFDADAASRFLRDGRGEAATDLSIGSEFLKDLNSRPHPKGVRITAIAGRIGDSGVADALKLLDSPIVKQFINDDGVAWFKTSTAVLHQEVGDGVVSVDSACLHGVEDVVVLNANHRTLLHRVTVPGINVGLESTKPPAIDEIVKRLQR